MSLTVQIFLSVAFIATVSFFAIRLRQILRDQQMNRPMKTLHLSYMPFYAIFNLIQIFNSFGAMNSDCQLWYILSMIFLWFARFIFTLEMFYRSYMIFFALSLHIIRNRIRYFAPIIIIFIICLFSVLIFNTAIQSSEGDIVCIPQYNNTLAPIIIIHIFIGIISVGSVAFLIKQLNFYGNNHQMRRVYNDDEVYQMNKLIRKFIIFMVSLTMSSFFILFCAIYTDVIYGILIGYDGLIIICLDILLYKNYDKIFTFLCKCFLPSKPPDKVKNLQEIATLFANKYENKFESVILETLKNNSIGFISDDVIDIIMSYIVPITNLEEYYLYKPYWTPSAMNLRNIDDVHSMQYFKHSKYGGIPYLKYDEEWPRCTQCDHKLCLFLQLNMNTLPEEYINKWLIDSDLYRNYLLQYFHCIKPNCFGDRTKAISTLIRFVQIEQGKTNDIDNDFHWKQCLREYYDFKMQQVAIAYGTMPWMENIIDRWSKQEIERGIFNVNNNNNNNDDEKDGIYDFERYEYETPSLREYDIFCEGIFDGLHMISKEIEKKNWEIDKIHYLLKKPVKSDKLNGYYCCLMEDSLKNEDIPTCNICDNYMKVMIYQLDGEQSGFKYPTNGIGAIFICDNHPFQPQLVLLSVTEQNLPF